MTTPASPRRRWFLRYSLRTFFVVVTVFGVWLGVQVKWIRDRDAAVEATFTGGYLPGLPKPAPWSIRILGARGYESLLIPVRFRPEEDIEDDLARLKALFPEANVDRSPFGGIPYTRRDAVKMMRADVAAVAEEEAKMRASAPDAPLTRGMTESLRIKKAALEKEEALLNRRN